MTLFPKQQATVDKLEAAYRQNNQITQSHLFLSGEMGVGKTYMGAQIAIDHKSQGVLIIVPSTISTKWAKVIQEMDPTVNITIVDAKFCNKTPLLDLTDNHITIIPNQYMNRLFERDESAIAYAEQLLANQIPTKQLQTEQVGYQKAYNFVNFREHDTFFIYDEIHQARNTKLDCIKDLLGHKKANHREHQALFLTGTIFNVDHHTLDDLLTITNPVLLNHQHMKENASDNVAIFLNYIWKYISVSLSKQEVDLDTDNDIHQTIAPIESIPLSSIENSFYKLVLAQLSANTNETNRNTKKRHQLLASNLLDFPERKPELTIKKAKRRNTMYRYQQQLLLSVPLKNIVLTETKKYKTLLTKLQHGKKTLIYATDRQLIDQLVSDLTNAGYPSDKLPKSIKPEQYSEYINDSLNNHEIFIVDPNDITVGVDINADVLIWYQLLSDMTDIIQAQRRVYRMNSQRDSTVIFLPYALTYQEELVDDISNSAKNNAASYGIQDRSELAKKTDILLAQIKQQL